MIHKECDNPHCLMCSGYKYEGMVTGRFSGKDVNRSSIPKSENTFKASDIVYCGQCRFPLFRAAKDIVGETTETDWESVDGSKLGRETFIKCPKCNQAFDGIKDCQTVSDPIIDCLSHSSVWQALEMAALGETNDEERKILNIARDYVYRKWKQSPNYEFERQTLFVKNRELLKN